MHAAIAWLPSCCSHLDASSSCRSVSCLHTLPQQSRSADVEEVSVCLTCVEGFSMYSNVACGLQIMRKASLLGMQLAGLGTLQTATSKPQADWQPHPASSQYLCVMQPVLGQTMTIFVSCHLSGHREQQVTVVWTTYSDFFICKTPTVCHNRQASK